MTFKDNTPPRLRKTVQTIEKYIIKTLIALMSLLLVVATIELGYVLLKAITESGPDHFVTDLDNLMNVFGVFLLVLIGIELLDTIKVYFREHVIHVEVVMLVAIIAIARKIIVMDFEKHTGAEILGIAAILLALSAGYYLIKKTGGCGFWPKEAEETEDIFIEEKADKNNNRILERKKTIKRHTGENLIEGGASAAQMQQMKAPRLKRSSQEKSDQKKSDQRQKKD